MKSTLSILVVLLFAFVCFGQSKKRVSKPAPRPAPRPVPYKPIVIDPVRAPPVTIIKNDGEKVSGSFLSADSKSVVVVSRGSKINIKIADIEVIRFSNFGDRVPMAPPDKE